MFFNLVLERHHCCIICKPKICLWINNKSTDVGFLPFLLILLAFLNISSIGSISKICRCNTNKSTAIQEIAKIENIGKENIYTVGDSFNDLEMLNSFNGFCMESGEELVKSNIINKCKSVVEIIDKIIGGNNE